MTDVPLLPATGGSTALPSPASNSTKIYASRFAFQWRFAVVLVCVSLFGSLSLKSVADWISGGPQPNVEAFFTLIFLLFLPIGVLVLLIVDALRGMPRLIIAPERVILKSSLGERWANWDSVEPFTLESTSSGRFRKPRRTASARVIGRNASRSSRSEGFFTVRDTFAVSIDTILDDLNAARSRIVGDIRTGSIVESHEAAIGLVGFKLPWLTFTILAILGVVFVLENALSITPAVKFAPSIATLFALGALNAKAVVLGGEWHRLFTAPLLHANITHLAGNAVALLLGGWILERLLGRLWLFALFTISAVGGSLLSLAVGSPNMISVGASGALMGLMATILVISFRLPPRTPERQQMQANSARILIPSLIPLATSGVQIDYGAHFGGALSGALVAAVLLKFWPETERIPQLRKVAATVSGLGVTLIAASALIVAANYPTFRATAHQPKPSIWPRHDIAPAQRQDFPSPPGSSATPSQSNHVLDHGPGRVACDLEWSRRATKSVSTYPDFIRECMNR
ncbi:MAG: rhomboid family intramembrane serine protease [Rhodopseudomonas sp.]|uniref:rhomboid family intramembrane serine protease n=1 Tax=Rhodopseudomonas sp. TaxID=1078 RepID=UPI0039E6ABAE